MSDRERAWGLLTEFTQSESLRKHALAVEACMRAYARKLAGDENLWGVVGLLHDFDYEKWPSLDDHPYKGNEILKEPAGPTKFAAQLCRTPNTPASVVTLRWKKPCLPATS